MIFSLSIGSQGSGQERYVLYLPFSLSPGRNISPLDKATIFTVADKEVKIEKLTNFYAVSIGPFDSEEEANNYLTTLHAGLLWVSLKDTVGISFPQTLSSVDYFDEAKPVLDNNNIKPIADIVGWDTTEGSYNANKAVIRLDNKRLLRFEPGQVTVVIGISADNIVKSLSEALSFSTPENVISDNKLKLAIELYSSFFFELSENAQLITLVTVLEALTPEHNITKTAMEALSTAKQAVKQCRDHYSSDSIERKELERLLSRVGKLKYEAIGTVMREHVKTIIIKHPELADPDTVEKQLKITYGQRSKLLHSGEANKEEIKKSLKFLKNFVPRLLEKLYLDCVTIQ